MNRSVLGVGSSVSFFLKALVFTSFLASSLVFADGYFPDLNIDKDFRTVVEKAVTAEALTFSYKNPKDGKTHEYYVTYGGDYGFTRSMYSRPATPPSRGGEEATEDNGDKFFSFLNSKAIYVSRKTKLEDTKKYEIYTKRPNLPPEILTQWNPLQPVPYIDGPPLCQITSANTCIRYAIPAKYPVLQGPYFTFTLTALSEVEAPTKEYLSPMAKMRGFKMVRDLVSQFIIEKINSSKELKEVKAAIFAKIQERSKLITGYTQLYRLKAIERVKQQTGQDELPEGTLVHVTRNDLTISQTGELEKVERELQLLQAKQILLYDHEVNGELTFENLVSYIQINSNKEKVLGSKTVEEDDENELSYEFIVHVLKNIGPQTFESVRKQQGF